MTRVQQTPHADLTDAADFHGFIKKISAQIRLIRFIRVPFSP